MIRTKWILFLFVVLLLPIQSVFAISNVQHSVDGNKVTLTYQGTPPFWINIRGDKNIGQAGGYLWAKTYSNSFSYDMSFAINPSKEFYYGVKDTEWSQANLFILFDTKNCRKIFGNSDSAKSMNIFFVGAGYNSNQIFCQNNCNTGNFDKILENDIFRFLNNDNEVEGFGLLNIQPFISNLNKINVYMVTIPYNDNNYGYWEAASLVWQSCKEYVNNNPIYIIIGYDDPVTYGLGGGFMGGSMAASHRKHQHDYNGVVPPFIHELGHDLGLNDNYGNPYSEYGTMTNSYGIPNCDNIPGCPKWCSGKTNPPPKITCTDYKDQKECNSHKTESCLWLNTVDPYFNSQCIKNYNLPNNEDIGVDCLSGTGCYWGCFGAGYRPSSQNTYVNQFSLRTDEKGIHYFDPVSENFVSGIFNCCYPSSCLNYNYTYCSDFSSRYSEYNMCNKCP